MAASTEAIQQLTALFDEQPCWMIQPLADRLNYAIVSVRRFLAKAGYYSSFTHNGRWYTLVAIPRFSRDGLWFYQGIGFSRAGSLTRTLEALIAASPAGMTAEALGEKLHCRCHSVLVALWRRGRIQRQRRGRAYVYLAADAHAAEFQRRAMAPPAPVTLPAEIEVLVLAEFIRHPRAAPEQLARKVSAKAGLRIQANQVRAVFSRHGLKKTLRPPPSAF